MHNYQQLLVGYKHRGDGSHDAIFRKKLKEAFIIPIMNASFIYEMESPEPSRRFARNNPLPESWDRIGGKGGVNFTTLPDNGGPYTYNQRAIPYLENPEARHVGNFDNESYFDPIDAIKSGNLESLNRIAIANGKEPFSEVGLDTLKGDYNYHQGNLKNAVRNVDTTYGLKGTAAPWRTSSTGDELMVGGAEQIVTPLNGEMLEDLGIIPKY